MEIFGLTVVMAGILFALMGILEKLSNISASIYFLSDSVENSARHITSHQENQG